MKVTALILISCLSLFASDPIPAVTEVVTKMMQRDMDRQATLNGFTAMRRYTLKNRSRRASMLVRMTSLADGTKQFKIVEEAGSGVIRKHVFHKMLDEEANASRPNIRQLSRITPTNYSLRIVGTEKVNDRTAYVMEALPKNDSKYLIAGKVWVDAKDYDIVRVEGKPAKNPSFWTKSVHFVHTYEKNGAFWFPASTRSETDVRIFGKTEMSIEYFEYLTDSRRLSASGSHTSGSSVQ